MSVIKRTDAEIDRVLDWTNETPHFPGMTYEDGVRAAIDWLLGWSNDAPDAE